MTATITLTGGWEIVFYLMCIYIAIVLFCELPKILMKLTDWLEIIIKRHKEQCKRLKMPSEDTVRHIVQLYKYWYTTETSSSITNYIKEHWDDEQ